MTYTLVKMKVPLTFYRFAAERLREAGYQHAFLEGGAALDMNGIALVPDPDTEPRAPRCRSCRWWTDRDAQRAAGFVGTDEGFGLCELGDGRSDKIGSIYGDGIQTAPDFGCVQWEAKE